MYFCYIEVIAHKYMGKSFFFFLSVCFGPPFSLLSLVLLVCLDFNIDPGELQLFHLYTHEV